MPNDVHLIGNYVTTTHQSFTLLLERDHFPGGTLMLTCEATFPGMPLLKTQRTEKIVTLISNKQLPEAGTQFAVRSGSSLIPFTLYLIPLSFLTYTIFAI